MGNIFSRFPPKNTKIVESGQSVAAAETAAAALYAANGPQVVIGMPGAVWDNVDAPPEGVSIIPWDGLARERDLFTIPFDGPLVAINTDDGCAGKPVGAITEGWFCTNMNGMGGKSPAQYAAELACPFSHAVISDEINDPRPAGYMTVNQLRELAIMAGCAIISHSKTHGLAGAVTAATLLTELLVSREAIEQMTSASIPSSTIGGAWGGDYATLAGLREVGEICRYFSIPGGGAFMSLKNAAYGMTSIYEDHVGAAGMLLRHLYQGVVGYYTPNHRTGGFDLLSPGRRTAANFMSFELASLDADDILAMATPGARYLFEMEHPAPANIAAWKNNVDLLVAARNAGKIQLVTLNALFNAIPVPTSKIDLTAMATLNAAIGNLAISDPPTQAECTALRNACEVLGDDLRALHVELGRNDVSGLANGDFDGIKTGDLHMASTYDGWRALTDTKSRIVATGGLDNGKYLEIDVGYSAKQCLQLAPGGKYILSARLASKATGPVLRAQICHQRYDTDAGVDGRQLTVYPAGFAVVPADTFYDVGVHNWETITRWIFGVPKWAGYSQIIFKAQSGTVVTTIGVDDVRLTRIG